MKFCLLAVLAVVLLQGVAVNSQSSTLDSIMSLASRGYQLYQQGQLIPTLRQYVRQAINGLVNLEDMIRSLNLPSLPSLPANPSPPAASARSGAQQWPWVSGK